MIQYDRLIEYVIRLVIKVLWFLISCEQHTHDSFMESIETRNVLRYLLFFWHVQATY